jgi:hypothetical protein
MGHAFLQLITERVATTFELLPERVDLLSFVVEIAAATTILGSAMLLFGGQEDGRRRGSCHAHSVSRSWERCWR